jgi:hypothetical protein
MPAGDDAALADLELPWVDHGQCVLVFFDDLPAFFANRDTKVAGISYGKFDHSSSPVELICPLCSGNNVFDVAANGMNPDILL